jgi:hypothetical protein
MLRPGTLMSFPVLSKQLSFQLVILTLGLCLGFFYCNHPDNMLDQFYGAYYSGAQELKNTSISSYLTEPNRRFQVDVDQVHAYAAGDISHIQPSSGQKTTVYKHNNISFVWVVVLANSISFLAELTDRVEFLLLLIHALICAWILKHLNRRKAWVFLFLYALNPLVVYFVLYPYYYFGLVVPGALFILQRIRVNWSYIALAAALFVLGWSLNLRSTGILLALYVSYRFFRDLPAKKMVFGFLFLVLGFYLTWSPSQKHPIFTAYLGLGAYDSFFLKSMEDDVALSEFQSVSGYDMNSGDLRSHYYEDEAQESMNAYLYTKYVHLALGHPWRMLRNAGLNFVNAYGVGYLNDFGFLWRLVGFLFGLFTLALMFWTKKHEILLAIALLSLPVVLYYPPTQIYIFGNFILIAYFWTDWLTSRLPLRDSNP